MNDEIKYKISIDDSDFDRVNSRIDSLSQQQAANIQNRYQQMNSGYSGQAEYNAAMAGGAGYGFLSPNRSFTQNAYSSALSKVGPPENLLQASMTGFYGEPSMSPVTPYMSQYNYPYHFIPGRPDFPEMNMKGFIGNTKNLLTQSVQSGLSSLIGVGGFSGPLDTPVYRQRQMLTEGMAEQVINGALNVSQFAQDSLMLGGLGAAAMGLSKLPIGAALGVGAPALMMGAVGYEMVNKNFIQGVSQNLEINKYFRDATAPYIRSSRLGGGPDHNQQQEFIKKFSANVGDDKYFTRDDYTTLMQTANKAGMFQVINNPDQANEIIEKLGKNFKTMMSVSMKMNEALQSVDEFIGMGMSPSNDPAKFANYMGRISGNAFSAGQNVSSMLPGMVQAGQMYSYQNLSTRLGALIHSQNTGVIGETIRSGGIGIDDLSYFGGSEGLSASLTSGFAAINRTPLGMLMNMSMATNPNMYKLMNKGNFSTNDLIMNMGNFSTPEKYLDLQYRMPEISKNFDPTSSTAGQLLSYVNMYQSAMPGKKITPGEIYNLLLRSGLPPKDAQSMMKVIENSDNAAVSSELSSVNKMRQVEMETNRTWFNPFKGSSYQNFAESLWEKGAGNLSSKFIGAMGNLEHKFDSIYSSNVLGKTSIHLNPENESLLGIDNFTSTPQSKAYLEELNKKAKSEFKSKYFTSSLYKEQSDLISNKAGNDWDALNKYGKERNDLINNKQRLNNSKITNTQMNEILRNYQKNNSLSDKELEDIQSFITSNQDDISVFNDIRQLVKNNYQKPNDDLIISRMLETNNQRGEFISGYDGNEITSKSIQKFTDDILKSSEYASDFMNKAFDGSKIRNVKTGWFSSQDEIANPSKVLNNIAKQLGYDSFDEASPSQQKDIGAAFKKISDRSGMTDKSNSLYNSINHNFEKPSSLSYKELEKYFDSDLAKRVESSLVRDPFYSSSGINTPKEVTALGYATYSKMAAELMSVQEKAPSLYDRIMGKGDRSSTYWDSLVDNLSGLEALPKDIRDNLKNRKDVNNSLQRASDILYEKQKSFNLDPKTQDAINEKIKNLNAPDMISSLQLFNEYEKNYYAKNDLGQELRDDEIDRILDHMPGAKNLKVKDRKSLREQLKTINSPVKNIKEAKEKYSKIFNTLPDDENVLMGKVKDIGINLLEDMDSGKIDKKFYNSSLKAVLSPYMSTDDLNTSLKQFDEILSDKDDISRAKRTTGFLASIPGYAAGKSLGQSTIMTGGGFQNGYLNNGQLQQLNEGIDSQNELFQVLKKINQKMEKSDNIWNDVSSQDLQDAFKGLKKLNGNINVTVTNPE